MKEDKKSTAPRLAKAVVDKLRATPDLTLIGAASALVSMDIELWDATFATSLDTYDIHHSSILPLPQSHRHNNATTYTFSASECDKSSNTWCDRSSEQLQELTAEWCLSKMMIR